MSAAQKPLIERVTEAVQKVPLSISSTRRSGQNGLRNADEVAQAALAACEFEEVLAALREAVKAYQKRPAPYRTVMHRAEAILARLDGES